jgi:hypothetical protein
MNGFRLESCCWTATACLMFLMAGCGKGTSPDRPDLANVTGIVTLDGQPLSEAVVTFQPADRHPSIGRTDSEGRYELYYMPDTQGGVIGPNQVMVTTRQDGEDGDPASNIPERIPAQYNAQTTLSADVVKGRNEFNFDLTSK